MDKVALVSCKSYEIVEMQESIDKAFSLIGGIAQLIKPGMKVLVKPNLVMRKKPETAATTHPAVVVAIAKAVQEIGAIPIIGDSPGGPFTKVMLHSVYEGCGMKWAVQQAGCALSYDTSSQSVSFAQGKRLKTLNITSMALDADAIISVGKLKTHGLTGFTGVVKNMFGIVPGVTKAEYHYRMPKLYEFCDMLLDVYECKKPVLSVMDAVYGMEGEGPTNGKPRHMGALLVGANGHAVDTVAVSLMGMKAEDIPTIKCAQERNMFSGKLEDIEVVGETVANMKAKNFHTLPIQGNTEMFAKLPSFIKKIIEKALIPKPVFNDEKCSGCEQCQSACPAKVISMVNDRPKVDLNGCIRCFCCQELCPSAAVYIQRPWLARLMK